MKIEVTKVKKVVEKRRLILTVPDDVIVRELGVSRQDVWNWKKGGHFPRKKHLVMLEKLETEYANWGQKVKHCADTACRYSKNCFCTKALRQIEGYDWFDENGKRVERFPVWCPLDATERVR